MTFLKINNLSVDYQMRKETVNAAKNVNIEVNKGEILGLVGESGSGKSTVGNAIINLIDEPGKVSSGSVIYVIANSSFDPISRYYVFLYIIMNTAIFDTFAYLIGSKFGQNFIFSDISPKRHLKVF